MKKKRTIATENETVIAARVKVSPPVGRLTEDSHPVFEPNFSAVMFNFDYCDAKEISQIIPLDPPENIGGIVATLKVEVWGMLQGKRKRLIETWYFSSRPPGRTPQQFVDRILDREHEETIAESKKRLVERPPKFFKTEIAAQIDPWENARLATLTLLKEEYDFTNRAMNAKKSAAEISKAFIADCVRLKGCTNAAVNLNDAKFVAQLSEARQAYDRREKRKTKVDAADWYLANPRNWSQLYALPMAEIARRVKDATGIDLSPGAIERRLGKERLELTTPRKRGKPAKVIPTDLR
jgi:hypothetical protein